MEIRDLLLNIEGMNERFASLIVQYVDSYINMSSNKSITANNLIQQIRKNITEIRFQKLDGISGCVNSIGSAIILDSDLPDEVIDNTFMHEFTHLISKNEYTIFFEDGDTQ